MNLFESCRSLRFIAGLWWRLKHDLPLLPPQPYSTAFRRRRSRCWCCRRRSPKE